MSSIVYPFDHSYGPASEPVDISSFIRSAQAVPSQPLVAEEAVCDEDDIAELCSISELKKELETAYDKPAISAYLRKRRDYATMSVYAAATGAKGRKKIPPPKEDPNPVVTALRNHMDGISLSAYRRPASDHMLFIRNAKYTDQNTLSRVMQTPSSSADHGALLDEPQALLFISIPCKPQWATSGMTHRTSQHVFLSSQTLATLCRTVLCPTSNYKANTTTVEQDASQTGFLITIDDIVYGDGYEGDIADKLLQHISTIENKDRTSDVVKSMNSLSETPLQTLRLRTGFPYWMMHRGNCEHFFVVDQIRHARILDDPQSGYPLTTQITPPLSDLCRGCFKVPAAVSVNGDVRLGESPCLLCSPCWQLMGDPNCSEVKVIELPIWPE